ncbi:Sterol 3-beta-glucosyltransferase [Mortierella antarctica]|nr:Sterol 3-beta-glucosyltransferase [Mortierella antarctica]
MVLPEKLTGPPASSSALMQLLMAAFRSESSGSDSGEEDGNDSEGDDEAPDGKNRSLRSVGRPDSETKREDSTDATRDKCHVAVMKSTHDREKVANKLQSAFGYSEDEALVGEYSCWYVRSVLLPGYMYLTSNHVCFYANLPSGHDVVQKEGYFSKKSKTTKTFSRYWFILKNDVLSRYADQTEVYYPIKSIDLRDALSAEPSTRNELAFYIYTTTRRYKFKTDSELARTDWVKAVQKSIFHTKTDEESVKISIPLIKVEAVELNPTSFTDTVRISIRDDDSEDEYFFAYFDDTQNTVADLQKQVSRCKDSEAPKTAELDLKFFNSTSAPAESPRKSLAEEPPQGPLASSLSGCQQGTQQNNSTGSKLNLFKYLRPTDSTTVAERADPLSSSAICAEDEDTSTTSRFSKRGKLPWMSSPTTELSSSDDKITMNNQEQETFRKEFSLPEGEGISEIIHGYLLRVLPLYGKIYLSDNYVCFKAKIYGSSTKVIVPLADVEQIDKHHGTRFYFHGLSILSKTDEEVFFEFSSRHTRNSVLDALRSRITPDAQERRKRHRAQAVTDTPSMELDDPMESRVLDSLQNREDHDRAEPMSLASHPGFKPSRPLHVTCLTIGSRGDVQPYIAFCKRLMQEGHSCRIATHGEYKDWIEGHGIEFGYVGGDPGELIELCVENGMFTVSFIKEGLKKFRGWLDDLMETAWTACQNTDVLIESPSAMAGIHIAEALGVPYFRAFPFPWTRTRAFPHPFAVAERGLGRGYNYVSYAMIEQVFWKGISGQVNKWRKESLGLDSTTMEKMDIQQVPCLYSWSPSLLSAPIDWHSWVHVTGYWFLDNPDLDWTPPEGLEEFLEAEPDNKPVYIGFGSMVVSDPESMTKTIIDAVVKAGVRAIISKGWSDKLSKQEEGAVAVIQDGGGAEKVYPSSVYMINSVPHDWLFHRLAGVVHHGGAGTTAAGLRAGIPTVIKPYFGDQYFWAQRIEESAVGVWCHDLTVKKLAAALKAITTDEKMIKKAQLMGERIRAEDGVGAALHYFYHDLALAKQRVEKSQKTGIKSTSDNINGKTEAVHAGGEASDDTAAVIASSPDDPSTAPCLPHSKTVQPDDLHTTAPSGSEPLSDQLCPAATEPVPDRNTDKIKNSDKSAEDLAAELEKMKALTQHDRVSLEDLRLEKAQGAQKRSMDLEIPKDGKGGSVHNASKPRRILASLTTKVTGILGTRGDSRREE